MQLLLRLTRLDSGVAEPPRLVEAAPVLERVARMLRPVAEEKGVELLILFSRLVSCRAKTALSMTTRAAMPMEMLRTWCSDPSAAASSAAPPC